MGRDRVGRPTGLNGALQASARRLRLTRRRVTKPLRQRVVKPLRRRYRRSGAAKRVRRLRRRLTRAARRAWPRLPSAVRARTDLARFARDPGLSPAERRLASAVSPRMTARDTRRDSWLGYYSAGLSGLRCVQESLAAVGAGPPATLLDLPCGEGRVLRWLAAQYPAATTTACDLSRPGVDHCAGVFGSIPAYSRADFDTLELGARYDLAWCGSLATHLDADRIAALLRCLARHLTCNGLLVITTHGAGAVSRMREGTVDYLLAPSRLEELIAGSRATGFAYCDYEDTEGYGVSLCSPEWFQAQAARAGLSLRFHRERGWADHQDVFALTPAGTDPPLRRGAHHG